MYGQVQGHIFEDLKKKKYLLETQQILHNLKKKKIKGEVVQEGVKAFQEKSDDYEERIVRPSEMDGVGYEEEDRRTQPGILGLEQEAF